MTTVATLTPAQAATMSELPPVSTTHWTPGRKTAVLRAVRCGALTERKAMQMYRLSAEELDEWVRREHNGTLKITIFPRAETVE